MSSVVIFLAVLSVLVIVHEFGHFLVARLVGIRVEKFSIGFGPVIFGRRIGGTEFCFSMLPLGGFVKLAGEDASEAQGASWEFQSKGLGQKFAVVFAGPVMNAVLAFVLFSAVFMLGQPTLTAKIGKVLADSPAQTAGVLEGDRVTAVNGKPVSLWADLLDAVHEESPRVVLTVDRQGRHLDLTLVPVIREGRDLFGKKTRYSFVGVAPSSEIVHIRSGFFKAVGMGAERLWTLTLMIFTSLWLMVTGAMPFRESMTGPIGIFFMTQQAAGLGFMYLLYFMGSLSVSLFVLNLLPIPVLDGGHILFIVIERLKGSPLKDRVKERMTQGGLAVLLVLMAFVILQDVHRFSIIENVAKLFVRH